jgi:transcription elongation factor GreA
MAEKLIKLTKTGVDKLKAELEDLKKVQRPAVIDRIKRAKDYGDLSENAEYEDARNEQSFIEGRIQEIDHMLKYSEVIENHKGGEIGMGSVVKVQMDGETLEYEIVGSTEVDPLAGKISSDSPIGSALVGKKTGEKVVANTPSGPIELKILSIA